LGACFIQLPPHFSPQNTPVLERFLMKWPTHLPLAVEVRHPDFFNSQLGERYFDLLTSFKAIAVITDVAGRRDVCHGRLTTSSTMIRFVGNGLHPTDYQRIDQWMDKCRIWLDEGLHTVWFFTHEPDNLLAPDLAEYTVSKIRSMFPDALVRGPKLSGGGQQTLF
jgi:uncharacterized protein YecE (DUF72 family)